ncbi:MAG: DUF4352 domain-containing protein [Blastocatellia bacterium]|nr:DUF4352 domain-containing protein [Blastocatellia bacterium]
MRIKQRVEVSPSELSHTAQSSEMETRAEVLDEDQSLSLFDANLLIAGVIAVRVSVKNSSNSQLDVESLSFRLVDKDNRNYKQIKPDKAFNKTLSYYGIRVYNYASGQEAKQRFISHSLNRKEKIEPDGVRQGLLFFEHKKEEKQPANLKLEIASRKTKKQLSVLLD